MTTVYPGAFDDFVDPTAEDTFDGSIGDLPIVELISLINSAVASLEATVGTTGAFNFLATAEGLTITVPTSTAGEHAGLTIQFGSAGALGNAFTILDDTSAPIIGVGPTGGLKVSGDRLQASPGVFGPFISLDGTTSPPSILMPSATYGAGNRMWFFVSDPVSSWVSGTTKVNDLGYNQATGVWFQCTVSGAGTSAGTWIAQGTASAPSNALDLVNWYLDQPYTSPANAPQAATIFQPELTGYSISPWFIGTGTVQAGQAVQFEANTGGATTDSGDPHARSELREMYNSGRVHANWTIGDGDHTLIVEGYTTALPPNHPETCIAQIHDASGPVIFIVVNGVGLGGTYQIAYDFNSVRQSTLLNSNYVLGTPYTIEIATNNSSLITIKYNGTTIATQTYSDTACYFKAGTYNQSNTTYDAANTVATSYITSLETIHVPANSVDPANIVFNSGSGSGYADIPGGLTTVLVTATHTSSYGETTVVTSGTFTLTLPAPLANGECWVTNSGSGTVTVTPASGTLYNLSHASGNITLAQGVGYHFVSDGTNWYASA